MTSTVVHKSFLKSTAGERLLGFAAASVFSVTYYLAPAWILCAVVLAAFRPFDRLTLVVAGPVFVSLLLPSSIAANVGKRVLRSYPFQQIPKYFAYEEYHEFSDDDVGKAIHISGDRFVFACHPHGVFPFVATCAMLSTLGAPSDTGVSRYEHGQPSEDTPTAVASVLLRIPILKEITGMFGIIDASSDVLANRLKRGSFALYVGGLVEIFLSSRERETVVLRRRKGFIKLALQSGAKIVPVYLFGNTTCLSALTSGPLAALSRKFGVSLTLFWGRWGLPLPRPVKLVYARGRPIDLPHIPNPTQADIDKWHLHYCDKLLTLFDAYKSKNPDYANKTLDIAG
ncbi:hypothetical protein CTAYLR_008530 [Chrysophaeum taylorii]|uniref:Acyltransferase n=1 Tax=Chrysophaeum taylorii TaxID=2483200 RepID=A0AAD7XEI1_9STRA|nr:hypothetical protein CTAYLR_008530 [Chrysophaeum taylorii]